MSRQPDESEISQLFQEMRRYDERSAPPFREIADGIQRPGEMAQASWWGLKTLWVLLVVVALMLPVTWHLFRISGPQSDDVLSINDWQAPTDFLIDFAGDDLGSSVPDIDSDPAGWTLSEPGTGDEGDS